MSQITTDRTPQPAFQHNGNAINDRAFYAIACNPNRSVAVEACAGAGKTWMLVSRIVRALLQGTAPHEILAITFTKKAAAEMRQRLQDWLFAFSQADDAQLRDELIARGWVNEPTSEDIAKLRHLHSQLLQSSRSVQVRTFHSWFGTLVRNAPLQVLQELHLPTQYELLQDDTEAIAQVWPRFYQIVATDSEARADYNALVAEHGRHSTHTALNEALHKRVEFALADHEGVVKNSVEFADEPVLSPEPLWAAAKVLGASKLSTCTKAASALERALTDSDIPAQINALFTASGTPRKFSDKLLGLDTVLIAQENVADFLTQKRQHRAWLHQGRMMRLTRILIAEYAQLKRESRWLDMNDLERTALRLLSDEVLSGWVQERLDAQIRHLLIDEFQDTNPLQWQALYAWLTGYTGAGKAISVFFVGDPKQSIYRFRRAEPQVFKAAQKFVQTGLMGDLLNCDHTRRNAPVIMEMVNQVMLQAQAENAFEGFRAHSTASKADGTIGYLPAIPRPPRAKSSEDAEVCVDDWRDSLTQPYHTEEETLSTRECRQAAQWLAEYLRSGAVQAGDVMVLSRKRERLGLMQIELNALHIPAQQPEKKNLTDMLEVQDIIALLDVLVSPQHNLSLAQVLKSPIFGWSDADLVVLAKKSQSTEPPAIWWDVLEPDSAIRKTLSRWKQWVHSWPPHDALSAIYTDGAILEKYACAAPPTQRESMLANLRALLMVILDIDGGRYVTPYALIRQLKKEGVKAPVRSNPHAVQLLTVHGAKGLEAQLVLMLDTWPTTMRGDSMGTLIDWPGEEAYPRRFVFLTKESEVPPCASSLLEKEKFERQREELNALYVALTRCRNTLVFSSTEPYQKPASSWWNRLLPHGAAIAVENTPSSAEEEDKQETAAETFSFLCLPNLPVTPVLPAQAAIDSVANEDADSRIGQAMHRLLEGYSPTQGFPNAEHIQREFQLSQEQIDQARANAETIVSGEGAWVWDANQLLWQGNEVSIYHNRQLLRIDRLVQRRNWPDSANIVGEWWVLDYKSAHQPQLQTTLRSQLLRYRAAVSHAYPGQTVRMAFLTAQGRFIEIENNEFSN